MTLSDVRQACRSLRRTPWYAVTLALVVALGTALSTTVFAIVDGTLFRPLPYRAPGRLFGVSTGWSKLAEPADSLGAMSPAEVQEWRREFPDLALSAFFFGDTQSVGTHDYVGSARVDEKFFDVLGISPLAGGFTTADFQNREPIRPALISQSFWRDRFGRDPSAIGRTLIDDTGRGIRVVGILREEFVLPYPAGGDFIPQLLTPLVNATPVSTRASQCVLVRLAASDSTSSIANKLTVVAGAWSTAHPAGPAPAGLPTRILIRREPFDRVELEPIDHALTGKLREKAWVVFASAAALVLLASLNVTSLTIARVRDRWRDLAVRRSLGAGATDLVRLLATENAVVVAVGAAAGIACAYALLPLTLRLIGPTFTVALKPPAIDIRVLAFALLTSIASIVFVTALSARAAVRSGLRSTMSDGGGTTRRDRVRAPLVAIEVAVAFVIAVAGALVAGSLMRVWAQDTGYDRQQTALVSISAPKSAPADQIEALMTSVRQIPGVVAAGGVGHPLLEKAFNGNPFDRPAWVSAPPRNSDGFPIESMPVTSGYLEAAHLSVHDGRLPTDAEFASGAPVIVVTETVAKQYWPGQRAVGQTLVSKQREYSVIGVVADARYMSLDLEAQGEIYWPVAAMPDPFIAYMLVRFANDASPDVASLTVAIKQRCPTCWFRSAAMLDDALSDTIRPRRFSAWLFSTFGVSALLIVGAGVFGLAAMTTSRRTREIGIRMALGATRGNVLRQILREQMSSVAIGLLAGGLISVWLVKFVAAYLYKLSVYDPRSWLVAAAALVLISLIGALVPSQGASRIDPVRALRVD